MTRNQRHRPGLRHHLVALSLPVVTIAAGSWVALAAGEGPGFSAQLTTIDEAESRALAKRVRTRLAVASREGDTPRLRLRHRATNKSKAPESKTLASEPAVQPLDKAGAAAPTPRARHRAAKARPRPLRKRLAPANRAPKLDLSGQLGADATRLSRGKAAAPKGPRGKAGQGPDQPRGKASGLDKGRRNQRLHALPSEDGKGKGKGKAQGPGHHDRPGAGAGQGPGAGQGSGAGQGLGGSGRGGGTRRK